MDEQQFWHLIATYIVGDACGDLERQEDAVERLTAELARRGPEEIVAFDTLYVGYKTPRIAGISGR